MVVTAGWLLIIQACKIDAKHGNSPPKYNLKRGGKINISTKFHTLLIDVGSFTPRLLLNH